MKRGKRGMQTKSELSTGLAALSCPDVNRQKMPFKNNKSRQVHRILKEGNRHLNSLEAMEPSPVEEDLVESSTGEHNCSKTFSPSCLHKLSGSCSPV